MRGYRQTKSASHRVPGYVTGRPTLYREAYCEQVIKEMGKGHSLTGFAGIIKVSVDTIYEWSSRHPAFSEAVHIGKAARVHALEKKLLHAKVGAQAATSIFGLKNACPEEYAEVRNLRVEHNVRVEQLTNAQLREIAARRTRVIEHIQPDADSPKRNADDPK
jgi:hypothetical protein